MNIKTESIIHATDELTAFVDKCNMLGYKNNNSLKAMKFDWCLEQGGAWYGSYHNGRLVGISGVHPFHDGYRVLFRGAQLYSIPGGLSKLHMNCWMWRDHLPMAIKQFDESLYITTNTENDASGKMLKLNRLYCNHLAPEGLVEHCGEREIFYTMQNVWKLNKDVFLETRQRLIGE